jgi:hypothetical protein
MKRINLMWTYTVSIKPMHGGRTQITIGGNRRRQDGEPGEEVEIVFHDLYGISCLIHKFAESENLRLERAQELHDRELAMLSNAVDIMGPWSL